MKRNTTRTSKRSDKQVKTVSQAAADLAEDNDVATKLDQTNRSKAITRKLLSLRLKKEKSQRDVALSMGCNASKVSKLENGTDDNLKLSDVIEYLAALEFSLCLQITDKGEEGAISDRIKTHVFATKHHLDELAELASENRQDRSIVDGIHKFYGEVLFNFLDQFEDSYSKLTESVELQPHANQNQAERAENELNILNSDAMIC